MSVTRVKITTDTSMWWYSGFKNVIFDVTRADEKSYILTDTKYNRNTLKSFKRDDDLIFRHTISFPIFEQECEDAELREKKIKRILKYK